jgi:hypothetical protein
MVGYTGEQPRYPWYMRFSLGNIWCGRAMNVAVRLARQKVNKKMQQISELTEDINKLYITDSARMISSSSSSLGRLHAVLSQETITSIARVVVKICLNKAGHLRIPMVGLYLNVVPPISGIWLMPGMYLEKEKLNRRDVPSGDVLGESRELVIVLTFIIRV